MYSGVNQLIIAVNKLDNVSWSKSRFDEIHAKLNTFLTKQAGFKESDLTYVPCSGLVGENLSTRSTEPLLTTWFNGPSLLEAISNTFKIIQRIMCAIVICNAFLQIRSDLQRGQLANLSELQSMTYSKEQGVCASVVESKPGWFRVSQLYSITFINSGANSFHF